jgi:hypothetical protein
MFVSVYAVATDRLTGRMKHSVIQTLSSTLRIAGLPVEAVKLSRIVSDESLFIG